MLTNYALLLQSDPPPVTPDRACAISLPLLSYIFITALVAIIKRQSHEQSVLGIAWASRRRGGSSSSSGNWALIVACRHVTSHQTALNCLVTDTGAFPRGCSRATALPNPSRRAFLFHT